MTHEEPTVSRCEFLRMVKKGESFVDVYLDHGDYRTVDVRGGDLTGASLNGADFGGATFERVVLAGVLAGGLNAVGANFHSTNLDRFSAFASNLSDSTFTECTFSSCNFDEARLMRAALDRTGIVRSNFSNADMSGATLEQVLIDDTGLTGSDFSGARLFRCRVVDGVLYDVMFSGATFERVVFERTTWSGGDASGSRFIACDLSGVAFCGEGEEPRPPRFEGATFDSRTVFPDGFDPEGHGMVLIEAEDGDRGAVALGAASGKEVEVELEVPEAHGGTFLAEPVGPSESVRELLGGAEWPPAGYQGAEQDQKVAESVGEIVRGLVKSSDVDLPFVPFVLRPESSLEGLVRVEYSEDVEPTRLLLELGAAELAENEASDPNWWKEYYEKEEYSKLVKASTLLAEKLENVRLCRSEIGDGWSVVWYCGDSSSGSIVGLLVPCFSPD